MFSTKNDIIDQLQKAILPLQGFKSLSLGTKLDIGFKSLENAFPGACFPTGALHEFISAGPEDSAVTDSFVSGLLSSLMRDNGAAIWISSSRTIFPPALKLFGMAPERVIFIHLQKQNEILWAMEEALKCEGLAAVICELPELSFTASRRLQLAVEQSQVTGFVLRHNPRNVNTTACITRWKITSLPGELPGDMPGVGFPRWKVELLKVRNGFPGKWEVEFRAGRFRHIAKTAVISLEQQRKTG